MSLRDIFLSLFLIGGLPIALKRPFFGAAVFAWLGMMNPHRMTWGFAYDVSWAQMYAIATMLGLVIAREKTFADSLMRYRLVLIYVAWTAVTTIFALHQDFALAKLIEILKVQTMCVVTLCTLTKPKRIEILAIVATFSIAYFGIKGGLFTVLHGGEFKVWGPPDSIITDNNHLAVGLAMIIPLVYWSFWRTDRIWMKLALVGAMMLIGVSILGSYSRSAFLALAAMSLFLVLKSEHKLMIIPLVALGTLVALGVMPEKYWDRIMSIGTYEQDQSAMGRINVWWTAFNIANDRITGAGYEYYSRAVFAIYAPDPLDVHSSHSIYFQSLGEHGWIGLSLFLLIWAVTWLNCSRFGKALPDTSDGRSLKMLLRMIQVSLIGFLVGGLTVNIGNWDFVYYEVVLVCAIGRLASSLRVSETDAAGPGEARHETPGSAPRPAAQAA